MVVGGHAFFVVWVDGRRSGDTRDHSFPSVNLPTCVRRGVLNFVAQDWAAKNQAYSPSLVRHASSRGGTGQFLDDGLWVVLISAGLSVFSCAFCVLLLFFCHSIHDISSFKVRQEGTEFFPLRTAFGSKGRLTTELGLEWVQRSKRQGKKTPF